MKTKYRKRESTFPKIVDQAEWQKAHDALLLKEKAATTARDALAAERRRLPMVKIDKKYLFDRTEGQNEPARFIRRPPAAPSLSFHVRPASLGLAGCGMRGMLHGDRPIWPPGASPRPRYFLLPGLPRAFEEHREIQEADGMDISLVFLRRHRLQQRLRPHHRQGRKLWPERLHSRRRRMSIAPTSPTAAASKG